MDTVRFGRALGMGARGAAKAVLAAADAAASPGATPARPKPGSAQPRVVPVSPARTVEQLRQTRAHLVRGSQRFGEAAWRPFVRLGGVLWLELTGVFFGLFVLFAVTNAWKLRAHLVETAADHAEHQHLIWSIAMGLLFGYFCVSSFVRANRRSRGR